MALVRSEVKIVFVGLALLFCGAHAARRGLVDNNVAVFDVTHFGAKPDGKYDSSTAFTGAWAAACHAKGPAKVVIPPGNYKAGEIFFAGPCLGPVTVEVHGSVFASKDISDYANGAWIIVERVDGFKIDGVNFAGSFHGTGQSAWKYDTCTKIPVESCDYPPLPPNFIFNDVKNGDVGYLSSVDSKGYHFKIVGSSKVHLHNLKIEAPASSPHTNAANVVSSDNIAVTDSTINTGGGHDCVIWGADNKNTVYTHNSCNGRAEH